MQLAAPFARWSAVLAAGLGCLALAVVVATFPLASMAGQLNPQIVASTLVELAFAVVGLLVALRQPRNAMGWLLLAGSVLVALNFAAAYYAELDYRLGHPVRRRVQHAVDRRFNRARYDADLIVAAFAARLQDTADPDATTLDLGETVRQALEPAHLSLWTAEMTS
ncbi:MAG: hypothetical protein WAL12_05285 [Trebonia sp.]